MRTDADTDVDLEGDPDGYTDRLDEMDGCTDLDIVDVAVNEVAGTQNFRSVASTVAE